jgi:threonine synthase
VVNPEQVYNGTETGVGLGTETDVLGLRRATSSWQRWRRLFLWDARTADYDTFVEAQTREETLEAIREMNRRYATIAREASGKIVERLNTLKADDLSPGQVMICLEKAAQVERLARGEPPARV